MNNRGEGIANIRPGEEIGASQCTVCTDYVVNQTCTIAECAVMLKRNRGSNHLLPQGIRSS